MAIHRTLAEIAYVIASGAGGQSVNLDNLQYGAGERWTVTDGDGNYHFTELDAGNYTVAEVQQAGWTQTSPAGLTDLIVNGGFETGDFSGWTLQSTSGGFLINDGVIIPSSGDGPLAPYDGVYNAFSNQTGPGTRLIYQDVTLPAGAVPVLRWADMLRNHAGVFVDPTQEYRVEIRNLANQVLATVFSTNPGDPAFQDWTERSADISAFAGQTVRIAFVEQDSLFFFNAHVDDVHITSTGVVGTHVVELDPGEAANDRDFGNREILTLAGDYNSDATADAADYVVWRKFMGTSVPASPRLSHGRGDGNGDGQLDSDDYDVWHQHFGETFEAVQSPPIVIAPTPNELLAADEAADGYLVARVAGGSREASAISLSFVEPAQTIDVQAPVETQQESAKSTRFTFEPAATFAQLPAHQGFAVSSLLRASTATAMDQLDAALLARFATPAAKQIVSDWQERDLMENDETSFGDDVDYQCVDEVFALLATG
jgi:hypothetical protein